LPSVNRVSADDWDGPGWGAPRPWVAAAWAAAIAVLLGAMAYLALRPDAWDLYQKDFGCTALTNIDSSYTRSRCKPAVSADRGQQVPAKVSDAQPVGYAEPLGLGVGR